MSNYSEYIEGLKKAWIGKSVLFENEVYTVIDVDYNGSLLIDKKARFTDTTAVGIEMVLQQIFQDQGRSLSFQEIPRRRDV